MSTALTPRLLLASIPRTRQDAEGVGDIDLEAQSHPKWVRWVKGLTGESRRLLSVWRGGAIATPTRRWTGRGSPEQTECQFCRFDRASARHWWAECPRFDEDRGRLQMEYRIPRDWWVRQPRCTAKSGWVTLGAAAAPERRAALQVAACVLGMRILEVCSLAHQQGNSNVGTGGPASV